MPVVKISDSWLSAIKSDKRAFYTDKDQSYLNLRISPKKAGYSKKWYFRKMHNRKLISIFLGDYPEIDLNTARSRANAAYDNVLEGRYARPKDNILTKYKGSLATTTKRYSFGDMLEGYVDDLKANQKHSARAVGTHLRTYVEKAKPKIWSKPAKNVDGDDIYAILDNQQIKQSPYSYNLLLGYLKTAFNRAIKAKRNPMIADSLRGFNITVNPTDEFEKIKTTPKDSSRYYFNESKFRRFAQLASNLSDEHLRNIAKLLILLGGQRPTQLLRVQKHDVVLDKDDAWITLKDPKGNRNTKDVPHHLPLTSSCIKIIEELNPFQAGFLIERSMMRKKNNEPIYYEMAPIKEVNDLNKLIFKPIAKIMIEEGSWTEEPFTINILRKSGESYLAMKQIDREVRNWFLSHQLHGVDYAHYQRYDFKKEKLECMRLFEELFE